MRKKTILLTSLFFISTFSFAQIKTINPDMVGKVSTTEIVKKPIVFRLSSTSSQMHIFKNGPVILNLPFKEFDLSNNTKDNAFVVPETGIYHFDAKVNFVYNRAPDRDEKVYEYFRFYFYLLKNGEEIETNTIANPNLVSLTFNACPSISTNLLLFKGDTIRMGFRSEGEDNVNPVYIDKAILSGFQVAVTENKTSGSAPAR